MEESWQKLPYKWVQCRGKAFIHQGSGQHEMYSKEHNLSFRKALHTYKKGFVFAQLLVTPEPGYR